jgi:hypothetical protein
MAADLGPWPVRVAWALLPITVGPALAEALDGRSDAVTNAASALAWAAWVVVLAAVVVPRTTSLTVVRTVAPVAAGVAGWAAVVGEREAVDLLAVAWGAALLVVALAAPTGDVFANGSSYGDERRMLLRAPTALLAGPVPLTWLATVAGPLAAPLLLAAEQWVAGTVVLVAGAPLSWVGARALHGLARRWVVFVPAGFVLHDLQALAEPVLVPRASVARVGPAVDDGGEDLDLTLGALGLRLRLELREPLTVGPRRGRHALELVEARRVLFAPSRPGAVLAEAERRRIPVGSSHPRH